MACMKVEDLTEFFGVIKKLCFDSKRCKWEQYQKIEAKFLNMYRRVGLDDEKARAFLNSIEYNNSKL